MKTAAWLTLALALGLLVWGCTDMRSSVLERIGSTPMSDADVNIHLQNERQDELIGFVALAGIVGSVAMFAKSR